MDPEQEDTLGERLRRLPNDLRQLIEKRIELFTLEIGDYISRLIAESLYKIAGVLCVLLGTLFLLNALAVYIGNLLDQPSLGYAIVSAPVLLTGIMLMMLRPRRMVRRTREKMLRQMFDSVRFSDQHDRPSSDQSTRKAGSESREGGKPGERTEAASSEEIRRQATGSDPTAPDDTASASTGGQSAREASAYEKSARGQ